MIQICGGLFQEKKPTYGIDWTVSAHADKSDRIAAHISLVVTSLCRGVTSNYLKKVNLSDMHLEQLPSYNYTSSH